MQKKKSQSSLEFLIIFGIAFTLILVMGALFYGFFTGEKTTLDTKHLEQIGLKIMTESEKVYFLGNGNKKTISTDFPEGITNISIIHYNQSSLSFDILEISYYGDKDIYSLYFQPQEEYVRFNCTKCTHVTSLAKNYSYYNQSSDFSQGAKRIEVRSLGDYVSIDFVKE
ncbi:MAG: hypothetical protein PF569_06070 [Candidatus Woesearchaeota archaeon]|jgi:hypothetical protein|nr:hypothetical protein [Candidatus Woesearchaeota archaeon]